MNASPVDRGNYYRGLLVVTKQDRVVDPRERELMLIIGQLLDFDRRFCEAAIGDLLRNPHIGDTPILFEDPAIAECFLRDGLRLALADQALSPAELKWLRSVAEANCISQDWLDSELQRCASGRPGDDIPETLAIRDHLPSPTKES
jgi:hypothetical protein